MNFEETGHSVTVVSFECGFCSRMEDEADKQTCLCVRGRHIKMMAAIPAPQKGGGHLRYMVTEVTRFVDAYSTP